MSEPVIEVRDLVKRYRKATVDAVAGVSFGVEAGQFFALLGPNGAGKTTTISILTTTLAPTSGTVRIAGHDAINDAARVRRRVGIIFQRPSIDTNLSGEENIRIHAQLYGMYPYRPIYRLMPREYRQQVAELAAVVGLDRDLFKPVRTMSGGMVRKLEIIRGLMHRPDVLFLDEPTSGLDAASRRSLWEYLDGVRRRYATTVFLTTHYLQEAEGVDAVCVLNHGRVVSLGPPAQLKRDLVDEHLILDAADRPALLAELARLGLTARGEGPFQVAPQGRTPQALLKALNVELTEFQVHSPSLEDAYLKLVGEPA